MARWISAGEGRDVALVLTNHLFHSKRFSLLPLSSDFRFGFLNIMFLMYIFYYNFNSKLMEVVIWHINKV